MPLAKVIAERPDVFNHNVEVVPRLYPLARRGSEFARSCRVLRLAGELGEGEVVTQVRPDGWGLGETFEEMIDAFGALRQSGVQGADCRAVPAPLRAPSADRALLASRRVTPSSSAPHTRSASATSPPVRSCAPPPTHADQHVGWAGKPSLAGVGPLAAARP